MRVSDIFFIVKLHLRQLKMFVFFFFSKMRKKTGVFNFPRSGESLPWKISIRNFQLPGAVEKHTTPSAITRVLFQGLFGRTHLNIDKSLDTTFSTATRARKKAAFLT